MCIAAVFLTGCAECRPGDTRCAGDHAQECAPSEEWTTVEDCGDVTPGAWECCEGAVEFEGDEMAGCVPAGECDAGTGE